MKKTLFIRNVSSQTGTLVYLASALILASCGKPQDPSASSVVGVRAVLEGQSETGYIPDPNASGSGSDGGYYLPPNPDSSTSTSADTQSSPTDSNTPSSDTVTADTNTNTGTNPDSSTSTDGSISSPDPINAPAEPAADAGGTDGGTVLPPGDTTGGSDTGTVTQNDNTSGGDGGSTDVGANTDTVNGTDSSGGAADGGTSGGTDSSSDGSSPSGSDGGTVADNDSSGETTDGGTSPGTGSSENTDPAYCVTASDWVRFKLNAVGGKSDALAFADAQNPILAVEARAPSEAAQKNPMSQYKNGNSAVGPEYYEYLRQQPAVLLRTVDLKRVDYFGPKFRGALELDYSTLRWNAAASQLPGGWKKVLVTFYVCDDTNHDGKCSTEDFGDQVLLNPPTFKACQLPSAVVAPAR